MKKALFLALFLMLPYRVSAEGAPIDSEPREAEAITYRVKSSATVLEAPTDTLRLKEIITSEGKGVWAVHPLEEPSHDCGEVQWPDSIGNIQER